MLAQACVAAIVLGQPFVAAEVVFIAIVGEWLESVAFDRAQAAIRRLLARAPTSSPVRRDDVETIVPISAVEPGDTLIVAPGESIAADGRIVLGTTEVDQSALTGESVPIDKSVGDEVFAGALNRFGAIEVRVERTGAATTLGQVERLVRDFRSKKAPIERHADRLARYFLPVVEGVAALHSAPRVAPQLA